MPVMRTSFETHGSTVSRALRRPAFPWRAPAWCRDRRSPPSMRATSATRCSPCTGATLLAVPACVALLGHHQVVVGAGGHLRQVGDGQHLAVAAQLLHQPADGFGHGAADAGIDLVEDQRLRRAQLAGGDGDGQRDARQLAARGHLAHRPRRAAGMAGHQESRRLPGPLARGLRQRLQRHFEAAALHAQALHGLRDGLGQLRRRLGARLATARVASAR